MRLRASDATGCHLPAWRYKHMAGRRGEVARGGSMCDPSHPLAKKEGFMIPVTIGVPVYNGGGLIDESLAESFCADSKG